MRYAKRGQLECGVRVVDGQQDGLGERWQHGVATLMPKEITFVGTFGGVRFLKRRPVRLPVGSVDRSTERQPTGREILVASPAARVIRIKTPSAILEWAIPADQVLWAIEKVSAG
jgi:hypothetical protein